MRAAQSKLYWRYCCNEVDLSRGMQALAVIELAVFVKI